MRCRWAAVLVGLAATLSFPTFVALGRDPAAEAPAGSEHTCGVGFGGGVKCWGTNFSGQLGDGTNVNRNTPVDVYGLSSGATAIAAGSEHTCAVVGGGVWCWGANHNGQLGDGTNANRNTPVRVSGLSLPVTAVAAGGSHSCALSTVGGVLCWGTNFSGQLGDGTGINRNRPVEVSGLSSGVIAIAAGLEHTCALTTRGTLLCWGANFSGQLGDGSNANRSKPVDVTGLPRDGIAIAAGAEHTCAVVAGGVWCWGANRNGQLGDGTNVNRNTPIGVSGLPFPVTAVAAGGSHSCAVSAAGAVRCWGTNFSGQLGDGTNINRNRPVDVYGLSERMTAIAAGPEHTCALTAGGAMQCWGANFSGQLGDGTGVNRNTPVVVFGLPSGEPLVRWRFL